jgi:hypothetical protein
MRDITQITGRINPQDIQHTVGFECRKKHFIAHFRHFWKDQLMRKYPNFTIKSEYDDIIFTSVHVVIDNNTKKVYKVPHNIVNIMDETEQFIQRLIITIRDEKINTINDSKS